MIKRTMHDCAEKDYRFVLKTYKLDAEDSACRDWVLVICQQMVEKIIKALIELKSGKKHKIHNLRNLMNEYDYKLTKENFEILTRLTDFYYDNRYLNEYVSPLTVDEFLEIVEESLELYRKLDKEYGKLKSYCDSDMKPTNSFE